jgi:integrase
MNCLRKAVEDYLAMRRSLGFKLRDMGYNLHKFVSFMEQQGACVVTTELALRWAQLPQGVQPAYWAVRLSYVRSFARYLSTTDPRTQIPPMGLLPFRYKRATPYIYSDKQIEQILRAAKNLPPSTGLRPWTYYTLFGLIAVTGMRISEVIRPDRNHVDLDKGLLTVRLTKFSKSRLIALHPSTVKKLKLYLHRRDQLFPHACAGRFFLSNQGTALTDCMVRWTFVKLSHQIGLRMIGD